jgi:flagellar basal-body rod protein FlgB
MDLSDLPLFALADRRLDWVDTRQSLLARNIANADTPHWRSRDVKPFAQALRQVSVTLARTDPAHLEPPRSRAFGAGAQVTELAPDGNAVALDKELVKVADTDAVHELVTNLNKKYQNLLRTTIGR